MRFIVSADWHINLRKKKVPKDWQINRFNLFFEEIHIQEADFHIIAGDIFDHAPNLEEVCLFNKFLNQVKIPTYIIPGNHEATKKGKSFLENYTIHNAIDNDLVTVITENTNLVIQNQMFQFFPYGEMQVDNKPEYIEDSILIGHIRGEVPPHISAEYNFEKLRTWKLGFFGDLHFPHKYQDYPIWYPGSPMNVNFDRNEDKDYGIYLVEFNSIDIYDIIFKQLPLPRLIRKTIGIEDVLEKSEYNHTIFEVVGSIDELQTVENAELLDKKIAHKAEEGTKLDLTLATSSREELIAYLDFMKVESIQEVVQEAKSLGII
jgi:DNA repair exonuclease SbcCD nuclease subunit